MTIFDCESVLSVFGLSFKFTLEGFAFIGIVGGAVVIFTMFGGGNGRRLFGRGGVWLVSVRVISIGYGM